jgi:hypothetical protein
VTNFWIGVASRDHVRLGVAGGFCQLSHGKAAPLKRLKSGDHIIYYSPRAQMGESEPLQAFTAIGEILPGEPEPAVMSAGFTAFRRRVKFFKAAEAPIRPLLPQLSFTRERTNWGMLFRRGAFAIERGDYDIIAKAMRAGR